MAAENALSTWGAAKTILCKGIVEKIIEEGKKALLLLLLAAW